MRRVFVTARGAVSPYGTGASALIAGFRSGRSAVRSMTDQWKDQVQEMGTWVAAPLPEPIPPKSIPRQYRRSMGPLALMASVAANEAIQSAGLPPDLLSNGRTGVSIGSTIGSVRSLEEAFDHYLRKRTASGLPSGIFFQIMGHTCAANVAHQHEINGRVLAPNAACAASTLAVGLGYEAIAAGQQDIMICGGAEELHPMVAGVFDLIQAASCQYNDRPTATPRPFDRNRDGTVVGEGAGILVLESEESVRRRGIPVLAEIAGFSALTDGAHMAQPHQESIVRCLHNALDNAGLMPDSIGYVNAHGTGTIVGDQAEAQAIRQVFGQGRVPVSSLKGHIGHTLGASGALELIACVAMLQEGFLLPTLNLDEPGEDCLGLDYVSCLESSNVDVLLKNSFAFGGTNTVMALKRAVL